MTRRQPRRRAGSSSGPPRIVIGADDTRRQQLLETTAELALEVNVTRTGMPKPLHLALFVRRFEREVRAPFPPAPVVRALMTPLAALARRRGHAERYVPAEVHAPQPLAA